MASTTPAPLLPLLLLSLLSSSAMAESTTAAQRTRLTQAQQCRFGQFTASQPSQTIQSEGGVIELWNKNEDQFQCAGVAPYREILRPNSLSLPNFHPSPSLVYIEKGEGLVGIILPGCPEKFYSSESEELGEGEQEELHQKVYRFRQGDVLVIPAGAVHWSYNDGNEEIIEVAINDLNNQANQFDQRMRAFYLAGGTLGQSKGGQHEQHKLHEGMLNLDNIFTGFDPELLAEAFRVPVEIVRMMQRRDERGIIVNVQEKMSSLVRPDEKLQGESGGKGSNGFMESVCSSKLHYRLETQREANIVNRDAGRLRLVNHQSLPILETLELSAEKGTLLPNALFTPHWSMNSHTVVYITRGDARVEIVSNSGQTVLNQQVNQGDMFVIPQFYASTSHAGSNGVEWVSFKTNKFDAKNSLAGYTSVFRAMPLEVITNSYQVSPSQAQSLKLNRGGQTYLLSPKRTTTS